MGFERRQFLPCHPHLIELVKKASKILPQTFMCVWLPPSQHCQPIILPSRNIGIFTCFRIQYLFLNLDTQVFFLIKLFLKIWSSKQSVQHFDKNSNLSRKSVAIFSSEKLGKQEWKGNHFWKVFFVRQPKLKLFHILPKNTYLTYCKKNSWMQLYDSPLVKVDLLMRKNILMTNGLTQWEFLE